MPFQVSPGVNVSEIDLTTIVPAVSTSIGVVAGRFHWGPMSKRVLVNNEDVLAANFGKPDNDNFQEWFTAASFLSYSNQLYIGRADNSANNSDSSSTGTSRILNDDDYETKDSEGNLPTENWISKYPGELGNSLKVAVCQSANTWESTPSTAVFNFAADSLVANTSSANVVSSVSAGDLLYFANSTVKIDLQVASVGTSTATGTNFTLVSAPSTVNLGGSTLATSAGVVKRRWEYYDWFDGAPGTSAYATSRGGANDELHVVVVDEDGDITGVKETVIERYPFVSRAFDARRDDGSTQYYKSAINTQSSWIWWGQHDTTLGLTVQQAAPATTTFVNSSDLGNTTRTSLGGGTKGNAPTEGQITDAYDLFANGEEVDISIIMGADATATVAQHLIQDIAEVRKDCVVAISPESTDVVNNSTFSGAETEDVIAFRNAINVSSSYGIMDSGWKYMYDKYNDVYRYVPLNGDIAGTMARTDNLRDPWYSPAGYNRGNIRNIVRLAYNPPKAQRDELYKSGVNPVVTFPGQGTVLFGDKTLLDRPSAFDRINVRRLFIVLEKAISNAAQYSLFEFNDEFTRAQFRNLVEPFLRDVQGRRGIFDFRVVCDETNNTPEIIDRNEFIGDIYIKPARSINFIQLNFIAVRTGVAFEEVVGQF
jgi:phage tail sheath protein FI